MSKLPVFRLPIYSKPSAPTIIPTFDNCLGTFTIDSPAHHDSPLTPIESPNPTVAAASQVETINTATPGRRGCIAQDRENQRPTHEWNSLEEFHAWRADEELKHGIELLLSRSHRRSAENAHWQSKLTYSCSRQGTGGKSKYVKKCMDRIRKRPIKRTGCRCRVRIKTYHHVSTVLGWYESEHDHAIGVANLVYTRLPDSTRGYVINLFRTNMSMSPKEVFTRVRRAHGKHERGHYITMQDIYRLRKIVKQEESARSSMSSDSDQPSCERSEGSPINEDEVSTIQLEDISEMGSTTEVDEDLDVLDEQSDGYADPGNFPSRPTGSASLHLHTASARAGMEFAASPAIPAASMEPTVSPASSIAPAMESAALPAVPATHWQATHFPYYMPPGWFMPPPVVVYIPDPPYQMTLYPLYPVYCPPATS